MTWLGVIGILLGLVAYKFAFVERTRTRVAIFAFVYLAHLAATIVYYLYASTSSADTLFYYEDPLGYYYSDFQMNTYVIIFFVQSLKLSVGGSYFDYFLVFQAFGFWGVALLMRVLEEVYQELRVEQPSWIYLVLFLPGVHFWTAAIGKDAPLFLASALAVWGSMQLRRRFIWIAIAIGLMMLVRPHIALLALISFAGAAFFDPRAKIYVKAALLVAAVGGLAVAATTIRSTFTVDVTSVSSMSDFFETKAEVTENVEGGSSVVGASFPVRLISLLFRPFFFDSNDPLGWVASFENLFLLIVILTLLWRLPISYALTRQVFFLRYSILFFISLTLMLSFVYYNVGLGLRQKMMFMPPLLAFFACVVAVRRTRRSSMELAPT